MLRRNLRTAHLTYAERQKYAAARKAEIANGKQAKSDTLDRLRETTRVIEEAFQPEADKLFKQIVDGWIKSFDYVIKHGGGDRAGAQITYNRVRTVYTGRNFETNPIPSFKGQKYTGRHEVKSEEWYQYLQQIEPLEALKQAFADTQMAFIIDHGWAYDSKAVIDYANKDAKLTVEANKYKLLDGIARYLQPYQTAEVESKEEVRAYAKGFQGEFILKTDQGRIKFTTKAITAEGPVVSFHWRYIIHVKNM